MGFARTLENEVRDRLQADPFFEDIPVFTTDNLLIPNEIQRALGMVQGLSGKFGACVTVQSCQRNAQWQNVKGPFYNDVRLDVIVEEAPTINRNAATGTLKPFDDIAEKIAVLLNLDFHPANCTSPIRPAATTIDKPVISGNPPDHVSQTCHFVMSGTIQLTIDKAATPVIAAGPDGVVLTCDTAGAAIFWTVGGKWPWPRHGETQLYTGLFNPGLGVIVNARAFLAGYQPSDIATATV